LTYLLNKDGFYYYNRRIPQFLKPYDPRPFVRFALHTDSRKEAHKLAPIYSEALEDYWRSLVREKKKHCPDSFKVFASQARLAGFISHGEDNPSPTIPAAISGEKKTDRITIQQGLARFWDFARDKVINKSPNQLRKWRNPRKAAIANLISCIGDKPMREVTRADILKFRDWWMDRIQTEELGPNGANKNFVQLKTIFETVNEHLDLGIDTKLLFKKLLLEENWDTTRRPFETAYIREVLLNPENLSGLPEQAKWILYAVAETGAGISEQLGLFPEDIHLDCDIPYIEIVPRHKKALKTRYRKRIIPLIGFALDAFKACPNGFDQYRDRPDQLSFILGSYLRNRKLLPSENHTVYSLRHSFQDRLLAANAPDRVQADLMGHKFSRPTYGDGASLNQKKEWLDRIRIKS